MAYRFRHATCNEAFKYVSFADTCRAVKRAGYEGIEIAPFTLAEDPATITAEQRREYQRVMREEGLIFAGLHWLMVSPKGLHVTTPDDSLRARSWRHIDNLIDLCAELGPDGVMVFGSPQQRSAVDGSTPADAAKRYVEGLAGVAKHAEERGVRVLIEPLSPSQTNVVTTLAEAAAIVDEIGSTAVQTMFDTHNAVDEVEPHAVLVDRFYDKIKHVHVNERNGGHCGSADYDFKPVLRVLAKRNYPGWVSLEAFDFTPGAERLITESLRYLEKETEQL